MKLKRLAGLNQCEYLYESALECSHSYRHQLFTQFFPCDYQRGINSTSDSKEISSELDSTVDKLMPKKFRKILKIGHLQKISMDVQRMGGNQSFYIRKVKDEAVEKKKQYGGRNTKTHFQTEKKSLFMGNFWFFIRFSLLVHTYRNVCFYNVFSVLLSILNRICA